MLHKQTDVFRVVANVYKDMKVVWHYAKYLNIDFILKFVVSNSKYKIFIIRICFEDFLFRYPAIIDMIGSIAVNFNVRHTLKILSCFKN